MSLLLLTLCFLNGLGLLALTYAVLTAPDGFEDQTGFHTGDRPVDPAIQRELMLALNHV